VQCSISTQCDDAFFFDHEGLEAVAAYAVIGDGLRYFKEHRVLTVDRDQDRLWAQVED